LAAPSQQPGLESAAAQPRHNPVASMQGGVHQAHATMTVNIATQTRLLVTDGLVGTAPLTWDKRRPMYGLNYRKVSQI
jgi:hypothetical protein